MCNRLNYPMYVLCVGISILPHFFSPSAQIKYEIPKVLFFYGFTIILTFFSLLCFKIYKQKIKLNFFKIVLFYYCCVVFTSLLGKDFEKSIGGNYYRLDGIITLTFYILFSLSVFIIWQEKYNKKFCLFISISTAIVNVMLMGSYIIDIAYYHTNVTYIIPRGYTFGNPNFLAGYLIVILPFLAYSIMHIKSNLSKKFLFANLFTTIISIVATQSRAGLLLLPLFGIMFFIFINKKNKLILPLVLIFILICCVFLNFSLRQNQFIAESRLRIFTKGLIAFKVSPVVGYGFANFDYAFDSVDWPIKIENDAHVDKAHSLLLEHLVTTGIIGFFTYLLLCITVLLSLKRKLKNQKYIMWNKTVLISLLLFLIHSQTNVISINEELYFWFIVGLTLREG